MCHTNETPSLAGEDIKAQRTFLDKKYSALILTELTWRDSAIMLLWQNLLITLIATGVSASRLGIPTSRRMNPDVVVVPFFPHLWYIWFRPTNPLANREKRSASNPAATAPILHFSVWAYYFKARAYIQYHCREGRRIHAVPLPKPFNFKPHTRSLTRRDKATIDLINTAITLHCNYPSFVNPKNEPLNPLVLAHLFSVESYTQENCIDGKEHHSNIARPKFSYSGPLNQKESIMINNANWHLQQKCGQPVRIMV